MKSYGLCAIEFVNLCNSAGNSTFLRKRQLKLSILIQQFQRLRKVSLYLLNKSKHGLCQAPANHRLIFVSQANIFQENKNHSNDRFNV